MAAKKILMIVGDFCEDYETMVPYQILEMVGHSVHTVSPGKKPGSTVKTAIHDFEGDQTYTEKRGHNFKVTHDFEKTKAEDYDALVIPGGRAPEHLRMNDKVLEIVRHFYSANKPSAVICHGPQILVAADVLKGRTICGYPAVKAEVVAAGGKWEAVADDFANACVDKNMVTAPAWPAHPAWMREFLKLLGSKIEA